ncbi:hypothetical protein NZD88_13960 [Chryseobacterium antibioticum]|uniref:Uncharacterized protein n=1 Tax=Chryseobacterium pyrolae TaxID=2987481 RepID=A0ABT2IJ31_9FLAO|nr:hypothetical protein [Chryseobacterium pyrolae]MCT2408650.1 hypothetical protein [Chryseobacterium pyrolae]
MFKVKINNIDVLPYIIIFLILLCFSLFQLSTRNILKIKYEWELGCLSLVLFTLGVMNYIKKIHDPEGVNLSSLVSTEDLRTPTYNYTGFLDQGTNISFVKFYFSKDEVYMYYRNFFPIKIYYGPFNISKKEGFSSNKFTLREFKKINTTEAKLSIESQNGTTSYTLYMRNISNKDFDLLNNYFK